VPKSYRCATCNSNFGSKEALKQHRRSKHRAKELAVKFSYVAAAIVMVSYVAFSGALSSLSPAQRDRHVPDQLVMHIHARLTIVMDGREVTVPANIGISPSLWVDRSLDRYGQGGMSPLHTHDESGVIHIESIVVRNYTLGELFDVWGVSFNEFCIFDKCGGRGSVRVHVNGVLNSEYRSHVFRDGEDIKIEFKTSN